MIDLRAFEASEIARACEDTGFFYARGHGVPAGVIDAAWAACRGFFALPAADKLAVAVSRRRYRGYIPMAAFSANDGDRPPDLYEGYKISLERPADDPDVVAGAWLHGPNVWPADPAEFRPAMTAYWDALTGLADRLLGAFAAALDLPGETFRRHFAKPISNISLLHYPPQTDAVAGQQGIHPHRDTDAFTILLPGAVGGLEVHRRRGGWIEAPPLAGCFVINIGNLLECWTAGRFISTPHRVVNRSGAERYSMAYFAIPDYATLVAPLPELAHRGAGFAPIHAGEDLARTIETNWD